MSQYYTATLSTVHTQTQALCGNKGNGGGGWHMHHPAAHEFTWLTAAPCQTCSKRPTNTTPGDSWAQTPDNVRPLHWLTSHTLGLLCKNNNFKKACGLSSLSKLLSWFTTHIIKLCDAVVGTTSQRDNILGLSVRLSISHTCYFRNTLTKLYLSSIMYPYT